MKNAPGTNLLACIDGALQKPPPLWLMRQAGRYLPEYRELRAKAGSFWKLCMTPEMAAEVTLQPIRRFGFDAAIIFSDILVVPYALGRDIAFEDGVGPSLSPVRSANGLRRDPDEWARKLTPSYDALRLVRSRLDGETELIGFAGAPWTLATYMAEGKGSTDQRAAKLWGYRDPAGFGELLELLVECVALHLVRQLEAGAGAVQIFDSWASGLPEWAFSEWVIAPTKRIVRLVRAQKPNAKIIGFPRGATLQGYENYAVDTGVDVISLDTAVPMRWAAGVFGKQATLQGNLDPILLLAGGDTLRRGIDELLSATADVPLIANLGHGILPETPLEHVAELIGRIRSGR